MTRWPLRIAVVAPPWFSIPPEAYGGIETMVAGLVDVLVARGHEITLIGSGRHYTAAQHHVAVYDEPPTARLGEALPEVLHAATAARVLADIDVDVVHDHTLAGALLARGRKCPTVVTAHGDVIGEVGEYLRQLGETVQLVAISEAQRGLAPDMNWVGCVHNAIDVATFPFRPDHDGYLLFLGRFSPEKGAHVAIDAAREVGREIVIAGKRNEPGEHHYFETQIRPRLGRGVRFVSEADTLSKRRLYAGAAALLFPIQWEEPFGLVMIEAMACGAPVVAFRRGSVTEVVRDGTTGFIVDTFDELVQAIGAVPDIDRAACRRHVEAEFDLPTMADGYEDVFRAVTSAA